MKHLLYVSHDGALDPLGQSQIIPYLLRLAGPDIRITLVTFEKRAARRAHGAVDALRRRLGERGIHWVPLPYHRRPPVVSTVADMAAAFFVLWPLVRRERVQAVHARGYVPAVLGVLLKRLTGVRVIFDMRELWVDGRVDGGAWRRHGLLHRLGKRCERWCLRQSDAVVSLTAAGKEIVDGFGYWPPPPPPHVVIPTCVDVERFANHHAPGEEPPAVLRGRRGIVYLGSLGSWYRLDAMAACFGVAARRWPEALFLLLTPHAETARRASLAAGLRPDQFAALTVPHGDVPRFLRGCAVSLYFITPTFSKRSSCPTKLGESLAAGLPVMTNAGVGDQDALLRAHRVGVVVDGFDAAAYESAWRAMAQLLAEGEPLARRCRQVAREQLNLDQGVAAYRGLYDLVCAG